MATYVYARTAVVDVSPAHAFDPIRRIGGDAGWYYADWLWRLRGALDLLIGGNGFRKGRRDPDELRVADAVDFMRVVAIEPNRRVLFAVEMRLAGGGYLEFKVDGSRSGSVIRLRAFYDPEGIVGRTYWHLCYPLHVLVFRGMMRRIVELARAAAKTSLVSGEPKVKETLSRL